MQIIITGASFDRDEEVGCSTLDFAKSVNDFLGDDVIGVGLDGGEAIFAADRNGITMNNQLVVIVEQSNDFSHRLFVFDDEGGFFGGKVGEFTI